MDKYLKVQCVQGLILSLNEQLSRYDQNKQMNPELQKKLVEQYYDAILEQLDQPEDIKKKELIIALHERGIISENVKNDLLYPKHENVGDEIPEWVFTIIVNGRRHVIYTPEKDQTIGWEKVVLLSGLAKTGKEILTITYTKGDTNNDEYSNGMLEVNKLIKIKEGMIFNVCNTSKGEK